MLKRVLTPWMVFLFSLAACAGVAKFVKPTRGFNAKPAHIMASYDMSPDCRGSVAAAAVYLQTLGAALDITWVPEDHPAIFLEPRDGEVAIHTGATSKRNALGETYVWHTVGDQIARAEIVLAHCSPYVVAHELGHAFGLEDQINPELLMHGNDERGGWGLNAIERRWMQGE